jgi:trigger factor
VAGNREPGPFERILTVTIDAEALAAAEGRAARKLSKEVKIKGFRPGKAPRQLVEKVVGAETLRREAIDDALPRVAAEALRDSDLRPAVAPRVDDIRDEDGVVEVDLRITEWPELDGLPDYRGREIEIEDPGVTDEDVEQRIDRVRDQFAELEDVDREAVDGDYVMMDVFRADGGEEVVKAMMYEVGSGSFLDGLDIALRGSKAGAIGEFDTSLPGEDGEPVEAVAKVLVKQVKAKRLPELTDEWVSDITEFETVDEMREQVAADLVELKRRTARMILGERLMDSLLEEIDLELPDALVDAEMEAVLHRFAHDLSQRGITIEQYLSMTGQTQDDFVNDLRTRAVLNLKTRLLLDGVAEAEGLEVSDEELDGMIGQLSGVAGTTPEEYREALEEGSRVEALAGDMLRDKARRRLVELAVAVDPDGEVVELPEPEPIIPAEDPEPDDDHEGGEPTDEEDEE